MTNEANEVYELMKCFDGSFINSDGELIISRKGNVYFSVRDCDNKDVYARGVPGITNQ